MSARQCAGRPRLGSHVSVEGGFDRAIDRTESLGAEAFQIFVRSPRQWSGRAMRHDEVQRFRCRLDESGLARFALAHASYLINLAARDAIARQRSIAALADELVRAARLGIPALVVHPGAHLGAGGEPATVSHSGAGTANATRPGSRARSRPQPSPPG